MARQELARRLEELNMSAAEAKGYGSLLTSVQAHIAQLHDLLERQSFFAYFLRVANSVSSGTRRPCG